MHVASSDRVALGVQHLDQTEKVTRHRCPNLFCVSNYKAANGRFCIEVGQPDLSGACCHPFVQESCVALKAFLAAKIPVVACTNSGCGWFGFLSETVHPKHDEKDYCCPECHDSVETRIGNYTSWVTSVTGGSV